MTPKLCYINYNNDSNWEIDVCEKSCDIDITWDMCGNGKLHQCYCNNIEYMNQPTKNISIPKCPWCNHEPIDGDMWQDGEYECGNCGGNFILESEIIRTCITTRGRFIK